METDQLIKENAALRQQLAQLVQERETIKRVILQAAKTLNLDPKDPNLATRLIKLVPKLMTKAMINPQDFEDSFSFFAELMPIIEKFTSEQ